MCRSTYLGCGSEWRPTKYIRMWSGSKSPPLLEDSADPNMESVVVWPGSARGGLSEDFLTRRGPSQHSYYVFLGFFGVSPTCIRSSPYATLKNRFDKPFCSFPRCSIEQEAIYSQRLYRRRLEETDNIRMASLGKTSINAYRNHGL